MASNLIVIVGETASGKSALGLELAKRFNGEIICADSRTIYKGMDIGTAKPSKQEQSEIPHHLLDITEPDQSFTVADFKKRADVIISQVTDRGNLPIMVGGSGLYIDSVIFNYQFGSMARPQLRVELDELSQSELQRRAKSLGINEEDVNFQNKRHLMRAIENGGVIKQQRKLRPNTLVIGLQLARLDLKRRIHGRIEKMIERDFVGEVRQLATTYGWDSEAMTGIGYRAFQKYLQGEISLERAKEEFEKGDIQLAKKQRTWSKRNKYIQWVDDPSKVVALVTTFLNT